MSDYSIIKCYKEAFPKSRFVGKCYKNSDRVEGLYSYYWEKWFENGWFTPLEGLITEERRNAYPDGDAYVGLMRIKNGAEEDYFEYWIGMFLPSGCEVPNGYEYIDIDHEAAGVCWIKGPEWEIYCHENECLSEISKKNMEVAHESDEGYYVFERYECPRFTIPDDSGNIILDLGYFVKE